MQTMSNGKQNLSLEDIPCQRSLPDKLEILGPNFNAKPFVPSRSVKASSAFRGVSAQGARWRARICVSKVEYTIGDFATQEEAARAYDIEAIKRDKLRSLNYVYKGINDTPALEGKANSANAAKRKRNSVNMPSTIPTDIQPLVIGTDADLKPRQKRIVKTKRKDGKKKQEEAENSPRLPFGSCSLDYLAEQAITGETVAPRSISSGLQPAEKVTPLQVPSSGHAEDMGRISSDAKFSSFQEFTNPADNMSHMRSPAFQYPYMDMQSPCFNQ